MATQTGSYDFKAAKAAHDEASQTASNYITEINNDGIMVHAEGDGPDDTQTPSGWHISDVLEYIRQGVSRFWIGLKNQGDSTPTVRIGKDYVSGASDNESHLELDYHSLKLIDKEGDVYFLAIDLRDESGVATLVEYFVGDGSNVSFSVGYRINAVVSVFIGGVSTGFSVPDTGSRTTVILNTVPENGQTVTITYETKSPHLKAYTFGERLSNSLIKMGPYSVAEGSAVEASGYASHAEGCVTVASGAMSHAEGSDATASGRCSHVEGEETVASGTSSHCEGFYSTASGAYAHAEGLHSTASGYCSHAEGSTVTASGYCSHAQNRRTIAASRSQTAIGILNIEDANDTYALIIGNGTEDNNNTVRSNALTVDWDGGVECGPEIKLDADSNNEAVLKFKSENRDANFIKLYGASDADGDAIVIGDGGRVIIGGGESAQNLYDWLANLGQAPGSEDLQLAADTNIYLYSRCQTVADRARAMYSVDTDSSSGSYLAHFHGIDAPLNSSVTIDTSSNNGVSAVTYMAGINLRDKEGTWAGRVAARTGANGEIVSLIGARNKKTDGTTVTNYINVVAKKDGSQTYSISSPTNFRNAIGASSGVWPISMGGTDSSSAAQTTTVSSVITAGSGVTINSVVARRWGPICVLEVNATPSEAKSGTWTVGTLKTGFVPLNQCTCSEWGGTLSARISNTGVISVYGSRSSGSAISVGAVYFYKAS